MEKRTNKLLILTALMFLINACGAYYRSTSASAPLYMLEITCELALAAFVILERRGFAILIPFLLLALTSFTRIATRSLALADFIANTLTLLIGMSTITGELAEIGHIFCFLWPAGALIEAVFRAVWLLRNASAIGAFAILINVLLTIAHVLSRFLISADFAGQE